MTRIALILVAALALLLPATAGADNSLVLKDGAMSFKSDDPGIGNNYIVELVGNEVKFFDDKDPEGTASYPYEHCRPVQPVGSKGGFREIYCPKSLIKTVVLEPGSGEDKAEYKIKDIPAAGSGASGADVITTSDAPDDLSGEQGNDTLSSGGGDDFLNGDEGNDILDGGAGNDKITGETGTDSIVAGPGDDSVFAADGLAEKVDCGDGNDTVTADAQDTLTACENVTTQNLGQSSEEPAVDDKVKPRLGVGGSATQKFGKSVRFVATCSEKGLVQAIGYVAAGGINDTFKMVERKVTVGGGGVTFKLPFSKRQRRSAKSDLRRKRTPRVKVIVACVDNAGNTSRARRFWINIRR